MKKLIQKYNHQDTLLMISLYPKKGELYSAATSGVASYAKNLARNMNRKVIVLTDYEGRCRSGRSTVRGVMASANASACHLGGGTCIYEEENVLVYRCFRRNNPLMWFSIIREILKFTAVKNILLQFDFVLYGGVVVSSLILPFLMMLKLFGYRINVVMHSVVIDIFKLKGHVGLGDGILDKIKGLIYNKVFRLFYLLLGLVANKIVVLEEVLKAKLNSVVPNGKVVVIPHGVDNDLTSVTKEEARKELGIPVNEFLVIFFGFVNWFKGADFFVDVYSDTQKILGKKVRFVIAGGKSPTMQDKPFYQKYFADVLEKIYSSKNILITGYVPQEKIGTYFSAADIVVLPYRNFMTASGVFSLVFSYKKPFIVSRELKDMFEETDFRQAFSTAELNKESVIFDLNKKSCLKTTERVLKDGLKSKMRNVAGLIRKERAYQNSALAYEKVIFEPVITLSGKPALFYTQKYGQ